jgi:hypothetical protein
MARIMAKTIQMSVTAGPSGIVRAQTAEISRTAQGNSSPVQQSGGKPHSDR